MHQVPSWEGKGPAGPGVGFDSRLTPRPQSRATASPRQPLLRGGDLANLRNASIAEIPISAVLDAVSRLTSSS